MKTKRHEYKYAITDLGIDAVRNMVRFHPMGFKKAYPDRQVNNYYLDTLELNYFYQNIDGISKRRKFRYRWYDDYTNIKEVQLEIKFKENELGWKEHISANIADLRTRKLLDKHFQDLGCCSLKFFAKPQSLSLEQYRPEL